MNTKEFIREAKKTHGNRYSYAKIPDGDFKTKQKVAIVCKIHGEFEQGYRRHLSGRGCDKCAHLRVGEIFKARSASTFLERVVSKHGNSYDFSKVVYTGQNRPVVVICKEHGEFEIAPKMLLRGCGCKICGNKRKNADREITFDEFLERSLAKFGNKFKYKNYSHLNSPCDILCPIHGKFSKAPVWHLSMKTGCPECGKTEISRVKAGTQEDFVRKAKEKHGDLFDYSNTVYIRSNKKVKIRCILHDLEFEYTPNGHLRGGSGGCPSCNRDVNPTRKSSILKAKQKISKIHPNLSFVDLENEYKHGNSEIRVSCSIHGEFSTTLSKLWSRYNGCVHCERPKRITGYSKVSIRWMEEYARSKRLSIIQHAENIGEFTIPGTRIKVDGYHRRSDTVFEFHGDRVHGNPELYTPRSRPHFFKPHLTARRLYTNTMKRMQKLCELGYNVVYIWENDYRNSLAPTYLAAMPLQT